MNDTYEQRLWRSLSEWRLSPKRGCELATPVDPAGDHVVGAPGAPIAIVEYLSYGWPASLRHDRALRAPLREPLLQGRVCFAVRHFPLVDSSPHAWPLACAVEAAARQGRFWDLHEAVCKSIAESEPNVPVKWSSIVALAREVGLDVERLEREVGLPEVAERVLRDFDSGVRSGVNGTPCLYVAGIRQIVDTPEELLGRVERALAGDLEALNPPVRPPAETRAVASGRASARG